MPQAEVVFWDVTHGHATYVKSPNGRHIVVDLGVGSHKDHNETFSPLAHLWHKYGVRSLDFVIVTHPHRDHIDDIGNFDAFRPRVFRRPKHLARNAILGRVSSDDRPIFDKYFEISDRYNSAVSAANDTSNADNYGGLQIQSFTPKQCPEGNLNNHSIVTVFSYAGMKVVVPGDNESCSWNELLAMHGFAAAVRDADVLLAPHHGRESGCHTEVMKLINPRLTVISDGSVCDTSATSRYYSVSRGWVVYNRLTGEKKTRYCLTTRADNAIAVHFGRRSDSRRFLHVTAG